MLSAPAPFKFSWLRVVLPILLLFPCAITLKAQSGLDNELRFIFKQRVGAEQYQDESSILFLPGASNGHDNFDASNLAGGNIDGASVPVPGLVLAINVMAAFTQRTVIPLTFDAGVGNARVVFYGFSTFPIGTEFYLRDSLLRSTTQLGIRVGGGTDDSTVYAFAVSSSAASEGRRFTLIFQPNGASSCPQQPVPSVTEITRCGAGPVSLSVPAIPNGCRPEWFLASGGTSGAPLDTGITFTRTLNTSDTILIRYSCAAVCATAFTKIPVTIEMSPFNIALNPASATPGTTIHIIGTLLNLADKVALSGVDVPFVRVSDTELTFILPQGPPSGFVRVSDTDPNGSCPDSASFTVIPDACAPPVPVVPVTTFCGTGTVQASVPNVIPGCTIRWYLASSGTSGPALSSLPTLQTVLRASDTILVQKVCGTNCTSGFTKIFIKVNPNSFRIRLRPDSGRPGDLIKIQGTNLRSVNSVTLNGIPLTHQGTTDSLITFRIPSDANTGYVVVRSATLCPDSALLKVIRNCKAPISYTLSGQAPCGVNNLTVTVDSVAGTGCNMQWYLASLGTAGGAISVDSTLHVQLLHSDTILVRRFCSNTCISPFVRIPVRVNLSPFNVTIVPTFAHIGDSVTIHGNQLDKANKIFLNNTRLQIQAHTDTAIGFHVPSGSFSGNLRVTDSLGRFCPDSARLGIFLTPDSCLIPPNPRNPSVTLCRGSNTFIPMDSIPNDCKFQWYFTTSGSPSQPIGTGDLVYIAISHRDTLFVRRFCSDSCVSTYSKILINVRESPFNIVISPTSGLIGSTIHLTGQSLNNVNALFIGTHPIAIATQTDTAMTFVIPPGVGVGPQVLYATSNGFCTDSAMIDILVPTKAGVGGSGASISVRPNPAHGALTVSLAGPVSGAVWVELIDLSGRTITSQRVADHLDAIPISLKGIPAGLYNVRVRTAGQVLVSKVVVE